jgi:hypothetical protein
MNGTAVRPAWKVFGILVVTLAAIGFAPPAHAQGPASGGTSLMSDRDVASFPAKPGEGKLTVALLLLALIGTTAVAAELFESKRRGEAERFHLPMQNPRDAHAESSAGSPAPRDPEGMPLEPR